MNFHVANRGVNFNFGFPAGGSCLNCSNKIMKNFPRSLHSLEFYKLKLFKYIYLRRPLNFTVFISPSVEVVLFWWFYCCNFYHADYDRKLKTIPLLYVMFLLFPTFSRKCFTIPTFTL